MWVEHDAYILDRGLDGKNPFVLSSHFIVPAIPPAYSPAYLREEEEQWTVHGVAADDPQKAADEAE